MRATSKTVLIHFVLLVGLVGCGSKGSGSGGSCGADGEICCASYSCHAGLACQAGTCRTGTIACGGWGQACCSTAPSCSGTLACQGGTCESGGSSNGTKTVCAAGGTLTIPGATLTIPAGALSNCRTVTLSQTAEVPQGYTAYSPVFQVDPDGLELAIPASMSLAFTGDASLAAMFWSRKGTTGFEVVPGGVSGGIETGEISRFGKGFVADGVNFTDQPDPSCVVSKMVEGRNMSPSTIALFFTVDDCWGRPLAGLTGPDFSVLENGSPISPAESSATILPRRGSEIFASLLIDMSASTLPLLPSVVMSAKDFVTDLQVTKQLPIQIDIQLFAGDAVMTEWQAPTLDTAVLLSQLDLLSTYTPTDRSSTNLYGAVKDGLNRLALAEQSFRSRNYGGAFTIGYAVIFTDGKDTAGRVSEADAIKAVQDSPDHVIAVGLQSAEFDAAALAKIAPNGVIVAPDPTELVTAFRAMADRMQEQLGGFYLLGYCSPKRAGDQNSVSVEVTGATNKASASYKFSAVGFGPGCSVDTLSTICDGKQCGGLGCGACDDRVASCNGTTFQCVPF